MKGEAEKKGAGEERKKKWKEGLIPEHFLTDAVRGLETPHVGDGEGLI